METQVQWLLGENYTTLSEHERPLECVQEPGDVVYLPDGWLHATVSVGPTVVRMDNIDSNFTT
jgi:histone arginine demethylase JMJD6